MEHRPFADLEEGMKVLRSVASYKQNQSSVSARILLLSYSLDYRAALHSARPPFFMTSPPPAT